LIDTTGKTIHRVHRKICSSVVCGCIAFMLSIFFAGLGSAVAFNDAPTIASTSTLPDGVETGIGHLMDFCKADGNAGKIDLKTIDPLLLFVVQAGNMASAVPAERQNAKGSFLGYQIERPLGDVIRYVYNSRIPEGAINASSVNYSFWKEVDGKSRSLPDMWKYLEDLQEPKVSRGVVHEFISPDLHTGSYYEYDLKRAFLIYRRGTQRVFISLSRQLGPSEVGKKGFIVGDDHQWNYLYTQEMGIDKAGIGWAKTKIYGYLSACIFISDDTRPGKVKVGVFQWLKAGWLGINMVNSDHIRKGMERYASQFKGLMEASRIPKPTVLEEVYGTLNRTDTALLRQKALDVTRHILEKARKDQDLCKKKAIQGMDAQAYVNGMDRPQLLTVLMREYVKFCLGKETPLNAFWLALKENGLPKA